MAKNDAKESARLRKLRIDGSQNGATLRTRIVRDKKKYSRNIKHRKSLADARDFAFMGLSLTESFFKSLRILQTTVCKVVEFFAYI